MRTIRLLTGTTAKDREQENMDRQTVLREPQGTEDNGRHLEFSTCDTDYRKRIREVLVKELGLATTCLCADITIVARSTGTVLAERVQKIVIGDGGSYAEVDSQWVNKSALLRVVNEATLICTTTMGL
jgi:hypothetical protein